MTNKEIEEKLEEQNSTITELRNRLDEKDQEKEDLENKLKEVLNLAQNHRHKGRESIDINSILDELGDLSASTVDASTYKVDGTEGADETISIADNDGSTTHNFTFNKGILTSYSATT